MKRNPYAAACATVAGRQALADTVRHIAVKYGGAVERDSVISYAPRTRNVTVALGPYRCMMDFSGDSNVGALLAHWYVVSGSNAVFPANISVWHVNQVHRQNATICCDTPEAFWQALEAGFKMLGSENNV